MDKNMLPRGVSLRIRTDGTKDFRASVTVRGKHIALGSFSSPHKAHSAYLYAKLILKDKKLLPATLPEKPALPFDKCVCLINLRDNFIYFPTPIYVRKKYFLYYFSPALVYRFDMDDLFYYGAHKIMKRGRHLFVSDFGSQINIMSRFGIGPHAVRGRDYDFYNGDETDLRYENIRIINRYHGVRLMKEKNLTCYKAVINVHSDFVVGIYDSEDEAAIAYNKAADILLSKGLSRRFTRNYIDGMSAERYAEIYEKLYISPRVLHMDVTSLKL